MSIKGRGSTIRRHGNLELCPFPVCRRRTVICMYVGRQYACTYVCMYVHIMYAVKLKSSWKLSSSFHLRVEWKGSHNQSQAFGPSRLILIKCYFPSHDSCWFYILHEFLYSSIPFHSIPSPYLFHDIMPSIIEPITFLLSPPYPYSKSKLPCLIWKNMDRKGICYFT